MYIPNANREENLDKLVEFMRGNSFATLVTVLDGAPFASHIPLIVDVQDGVVRLTGHLAKANPQAKSLAATEALAIFTGPHAYVSPSLYEQRESVPTWNYVAVHAYGQPRPVSMAESKAAVQSALETMIETYDASYRAQWDELSEKYREGMMQGVVAFEIAVTRLEGKYKLSQNRSHADQANVTRALSQSADPAIAEVGRLMRERVQTT